MHLIKGVAEIGVALEGALVSHVGVAVGLSVLACGDLRQG